MTLKRSLTFAVVALALSLPGSAVGAIFGDLNVSNPTLKVDERGIALVEYTTAAGKRRRVLVWGAVNGIPRPSSPATRQVRFQLDYTGGLRSRNNPGFWTSIRDGCRPYDGPRLPLLVTACRAPDGSYWALQAWQRNLPMRGFAPWTEKQRGVELHVSHWTGELPKLEVWARWTYRRSAQGIFGRFVYRGTPVYGRRTSSATIRDEFARNVYIGTFNSGYGPGWKHDTAIATHKGNGGFCYTFIPQAPPAGYPKSTANGSPLGEQHRVTAIGPGVTPIVQTIVPRLRRYDAAAQREATRRFDAILGGDEHCAPER